MWPCRRWSSTAIPVNNLSVRESFSWSPGRQCTIGVDVAAAALVTSMIDLFHTYATETERGISRSELFELLQDHYADSFSGIAQAKADADAQAQRERHFERLYTWLKKHLSVYDRQRTGALPHAT